jgi:hypothetical protein
MKLVTRHEAMNKDTDSTEVTVSSNTDRIRISGFRKIRLYLRNGLKEEEEVSLTSSTVANREKTEEGIVSLTGVKRKLNSSDSYEEELEGSSRKKSSSYGSPSNGLDRSNSNTPLPVPQLPLNEDNPAYSVRKEMTALEYSPPVVTPRKLRIVVHDRHNPFLVDSVFEEILSNFSMVQLQTAILVSKRWRLFARNRMDHLLLFNQDTTMFSDNDLNEVVCGLEKIQDMVNQRLLRLSQIRRERLTTRFRLWRDNGLHKQAMASPPHWALRLQSQGFPLSEFRTYTVDEVFNWLISNYHIDYITKEHWSKVIMESNIVAFVYRPNGR